MSDKVGWICLHRQIQDCFLWDMEEPFDVRSAWIDLLLLVNHEDKNVLFKGKVVTVKRGQRITSIRKLSNRWGWCVEKTYKYLNVLESEGMIERDSDNSRTLLTVVNYSKFNDVPNTKQNTKRTRNSTQDEHETNTGRTLNSTQDEHETDTNNNDNNENNENNDKTMRNNENKREGKTTRSRYGEYSHVLLTDDDHNKLIDQLGEHNTSEYIKKVDEYCQQTGKTYKDYYLTILNWWRKDGDKQKGPEDIETRMRRLRLLGGGT